MELSRTVNKPRAPRSNGLQDGIYNHFFAWTPAFFLSTPRFRYSKYLVLISYIHCSTIGNSYIPTSAPSGLYQYSASTREDGCQHRSEIA